MNESILTGNLGADPRSITLPNGTNVCDFNMAVNRRYTTNGQQVEETVWVKVTAWRNLAINCGRFLSKGSKVLVTGRMEQPELFQGRDGVWRAINHMTATNVEFLTTSGGAIANEELDGAMAAAAGTAVSGEVTEAEMMSASVEF
ncbi:MAG: single-stranded DNA-binding protein [Caldilineaceae bacterium]|nr:single-stranded DNA-binding protein [Caldilineaceae bacterium]